MIDTNIDEINPEELIFGREIDGEEEGVCHFARGDHNLGDPITAEDANLLIDRGYLAPQERQNDGPPASVLSTRAGVTEKLAASSPDLTDPVEFGLTGYVVPDHRPDARITLNGMVATPVEDGGVIGDAVKLQFEALGDRQTALNDELETQAGVLFDTADELTTDDTLCRVWWD